MPYLVKQQKKLAEQWLVLGMDIAMFRTILQQGGVMTDQELRDWKMKVSKANALLPKLLGESLEHMVQEKFL